MITTIIGVISILGSPLILYMGLYLRKENQNFEGSENLYGKIIDIGVEYKDSKYSFPLIEYTKFGITEQLKSKSGVKDKINGDSIELEFSNTGDVRVKSTSNYYWPNILYAWSLFSLIFGVYLIFSELKI